MLFYRMSLGNRRPKALQVPHAKQMRIPHNGSAMRVNDYNGAGRWSAEAVVERYLGYCRKLGIPVSTDLAPRSSTAGDVTRIYPIMEQVIYGVEHSDQA